MGFYEMSTAQNLLIWGGLINVLISIVIAYALYWVRLGDVKRRTAPGLVAHKVSLWNGFLLFGLAVAIEHTGFTDGVNNLLAFAEVVVCVLASGRTVLIWYRSYGNIFRRAHFLARTVGLGHIIDLVVISGVLYGVARTAFGI